MGAYHDDDDDDDDDAEHTCTASTFRTESSPPGVGGSCICTFSHSRSETWMERSGFRWKGMSLVEAAIVNSSSRTSNFFFFFFFF